MADLSAEKQSSIHVKETAGCVPEPVRVAGETTWCPAANKPQFLDRQSHYLATSSGSVWLTSSAIRQLAWQPDKHRENPQHSRRSDWYSNPVPPVTVSTRWLRMRTPVQYVLQSFIARHRRRQHNNTILFCGGHPECYRIVKQRYKVCPESNETDSRKFV